MLFDIILIYIAIVTFALANYFALTERINPYIIIVVACVSPLIVLLLYRGAETMDLAGTFLLGFNATLAELVTLFSSFVLILTSISLIISSLEKYFRCFKFGIPYKLGKVDVKGVAVVWIELFGIIGISLLLPFAFSFLAIGGNFITPLLIGMLSSVFSALGITFILKSNVSRINEGTLWFKILVLILALITGIGFGMFSLFVREAFEYNALLEVLYAEYRYLNPESEIPSFPGAEYSTAAIIGLGAVSLYFLFIAIYTIFVILYKEVFGGFKTFVDENIVFLEKEKNEPYLMALQYDNTNWILVPCELNGDTISYDRGNYIIQGIIGHKMELKEKYKIKQIE